MRRIHPKDIGLANPRYIGKAHTPAPKVTEPEAQILSDVRAHCDAHRIEHFHIPAWLLDIFGKLFLLPTVALEHARDSAEEVRGFPDLILFYRGRFLAIELKTPIGKLTHAQRTWRQRLDGLVCRTTAEACAAIDAWKAGIDEEIRILTTPSPATAGKDHP